MEKVKEDSAFGCSEGEIEQQLDTFLTDSKEFIILHLTGEKAPTDSQADFSLAVFLVNGKRFFRRNKYVNDMAHRAGGIFPILFIKFVQRECLKNMDAMASMTITYLVGAVCSAIMYFVMNKNGNLLQEYAKMNWGTVVFSRGVSLWLDWRSVLFIL